MSPVCPAARCFGVQPGPRPSHCHPRPLALALLASLALLAGGCQRKTLPCKPAPAIKGKLPKNVVATVNGKVITEADLKLRMAMLKRSKHGRGPTPPKPRDVLKTIVNQEIIAQKAAALGLTSDAKYQASLRRLQAQFAAFKRKALVELYDRRQLSNKAEISDAELKAHFDKNAERIQTELHIFQILTRKEARAKAALAELAGKKKSFVEVAKGMFDKVPAGTTPWDLGYLKWRYLPKPWLDVIYKLKKGEHSGIIRGPRNRFWIIQLVDKRINKEMTFDKVKKALAQKLKHQKLASQRKAALLGLRRAARVVYHR